MFGGLYFFDFAVFVGYLSLPVSSWEIFQILLIYPEKSNSSPGHDVQWGGCGCSDLGLLTVDCGEL